MVRANLYKILILAQKPIPGENRIRFKQFRRANDRRDIQVALAGFGPPIHTFALAVLR